MPDARQPRTPCHPTQNHRTHKRFRASVPEDESTTDRPLQASTSMAALTLLVGDMERMSGYYSGAFAVNVSGNGSLRETAPRVRTL